MQFGKEIITTTYFDGKPTVVRVVEERIRVTTDQEELTEYLKFTREVKAKDRVDFKFEHPEGKDYYYIVKSWREAIT